MATSTSTSTPISVGTFTSGSLPPVCVVTGQPATSSEQRNARAAQDRSGIGIALVIVGAFFGAFSVREVRGSLPYNARSARHEPAHLARRKRLAVRALAFGLTGISLWVIMINHVVGDGLAAFILGMIGMLLTIVGIVFFSLAARRPITWIRLVFDERRTGLVLIGDAHPNFIAAMTAPLLPATGAYASDTIEPTRGDALPG